MALAPGLCVSASVQAQEPEARRATPAHSPRDSAALRGRMERDIATFLLQWRKAWQKSFDTSKAVVSASGTSGRPNIAAGIAPPGGPSRGPTRITPRSRLGDDEMLGRALPLPDAGGSLAQIMTSSGALPKTVGGGSVGGWALWLHCHPDLGMAEGLTFEYPAGYEPMFAAPSRFAKCPIWLLSGSDTRPDESDDIDASLRAPARDSIRTARAALLARLDAAQDALPGDGWLFGQRIRFRVDQGLLTDAERQARDCNQGDWLCATLAGYVFAKQGRLVLADSAFEESIQALPPEQRCSWTDIRVLLANEGQSAIGEKSCAERDAMAQRFWWLADPLFTTRENERRVEHFARRTMVMLRSALEQDERNHWRADEGGAVVNSMLMRYGWPTVARWFGLAIDEGHTNYLAANATIAAEPYSTAEYSRGRMQTSPAWGAVLDPFRSTNASWELRPRAGETELRGPGKLWWPWEHMKSRAGPMLVIDDGQYAVFRRRARHRMIAAVDLDVRSDTTDRDAWTALLSDASSTMLLASSRHDSADVVARVQSGSARRLLLDGALLPRPAIVSLEMIGQGPMKGVARARFGLVPPPALDSLPANVVAVSDPVFYTPTGADSLPTDVDAMAPRMLGRSWIGGEARVGMFWETYGVPAGDSVRVSVTVTPTDDPNLLQRIGAAIRLLDRPADGIALAWQDPGDREATRAPAGGITIYPRSVILNLSQLPKGSYWVNVSVTAPGRGTASGRRVLTIR